MKILFIGDVVGQPGREILKDKIPYFVEKYGIDFVIANGENASHGKGLLEKHYDELLDAGCDVITLGNHYNSKRQIDNYIDRVDSLIRPLNILDYSKGVGSEIFDFDGIKIRVTNLLGSAFMKENVSSPYLAIKDIIDNEEEANIHIVDFHAESTSEKQCLGYALDGQVSAVLGTHTHVQTRDYHILPKGTAYISDVGMCGTQESVIGFEKDSVVDKIVFGQEGKFQIDDIEKRKLFSAVVINVDDISGKAKEIFPIYYVEGD